jgi:hypothetical protein
MENTKRDTPTLRNSLHSPGLHMTNDEAPLLDRNTLLHQISVH